MVKNYSFGKAESSGKLLHKGATFPRIDDLYLKSAQNGRLEQLLTTRKYRSTEHLFNAGKKVGWPPFHLSHLASAAGIARLPTSRIHGSDEIQHGAVESLRFLQVYHVATPGVNF